VGKLKTTSFLLGKRKILMGKPMAIFQ